MNNQDVRDGALVNAARAVVGELEQAGATKRLPDTPHTRELLEALAAAVAPFDRGCHEHLPIVLERREIMALLGEDVAYDLARLNRRLRAGLNAAQPDQSTGSEEGK